MIIRILEVERLFTNIRWYVVTWFLRIYIHRLYNKLQSKSYTTVPTILSRIDKLLMLASRQSNFIIYRNNLSKSTLRGPTLTQPKIVIPHLPPKGSISTSPWKHRAESRPSRWSNFSRKLTKATRIVDFASARNFHTGNLLPQALPTYASQCYSADSALIQDACGHINRKFRGDERTWIFSRPILSETRGKTRVHAHRFVRHSIPDLTGGLRAGWLFAMLEEYK